MKKILTLTLASCALLFAMHGYASSLLSTSADTAANATTNATAASATTQATSLGVVTCDSKKFHCLSECKGVYPTQAKSCETCCSK